MVDKKVIRELFRAVEEKFNFELVKCEKYKEVVKRRRNKADFIEKNISEEDFELLQEYIEIENEVTAIELEEAFVKGFSTAVQLIRESLQ